MFLFRCTVPVQCTVHLHLASMYLAHTPVMYPLGILVTGFTAKWALQQGVTFQ